MKLFFLLLLLSSSYATLTEKHREFADGLTSIIHNDSKKNHCTSSLGVSMAMSLLYPSMKGDAADEVESVFGFTKNTNSAIESSTNSLVISKVKIVENNNINNSKEEEQEQKQGSTGALVENNNNSKEQEQQQGALEWSDVTSELNTNYFGGCAYQLDSPEDECEEYNPTVTISNSVWTQDSREVMPTYAAVLQDTLMPIDLTSSASGGIINKWVQNVTNGLIKDIVEENKPLSPPLITLAVNAIYLKASWKDAFLTKHTSEDNFYSDETKNARFMHSVEHYNYYADDNWQIVEVPFFTGYRQNEVFATYFVLSSGDDKMSSSALLEKVASNKFKRTKVALALPKFTFSTEYDGDTLRSALNTLGVQTPFGSGGLCIYVDDMCQSKIDYVLQKTYVSVDEGGMEAAAVTAMGIRATSVMPQEADPALFLADHPFQFFVYNSRTDVVLLEGIVRDPVTEDTTTPELTLRHDDVAFWKDTFQVNPEKHHFVVDDSETKRSVSAASTPMIITSTILAAFCVLTCL